MKFGSATCTILRRWLTENDISEKDIPEVNNQFQYWMPYDCWSDKKFLPDPFEEHLAKYWDDKLPSMLLTANVQNIFLRGVPESCSCFNEDASLDKDVFNKSPFQHHPSETFGTLCMVHGNCLVKILHNPDCVDPQFCVGRSPCIISCETDVKKSFLTLSSKNSKNVNNSYWKSFEVFIEPCDKKNCRNVGTLCETYNSCVESYLVTEKTLFAKNICDFIHGASDFPRTLPPETLNALMQVKKVEGTRDRLRSKLMDKKQKLVTCMDFFNEKLLQDPAYRIKMFEQALDKFRREMSAEAYLCGCNVWEDHAHDCCKGLQGGFQKSMKKHNESEKANAQFICQSHISSVFSHANSHANSHTGTSVAVGTDERSGVGKVLQARKKCAKKTKNNNGNKNGDEKIMENGTTSEKNQSLGSVNKKSELQSGTQASESATKNGESSKAIIDENNSVKNNSNPLPKTEKTIGNVSKVKNRQEHSQNKGKENGDLNFSEIMSMLNLYSASEMFPGKKADEEEENSHKNNKIKMESTKKKIKLHVCAYCNEKESQPSAFKKCSRCKMEKFPHPRYYCSRECQVGDWEESHRDEHQRNAAIQ